MSTISEQSQEQEQLLSIGQASEYLGISIDTLRRWEKKGRLEPFRSPGGHRYYKKSLLDSLFGKRYTRDEPTIRSSLIKKPKEISQETLPKEEQKEEVKVGLPSWRAIREEVIEETVAEIPETNQPPDDLKIEPLDRPVRDVQIPKPVRIEVIKRDLLLTPEEAYIRQQSISVLNLPTETVEEKTETLIPAAATTQEPEIKKETEEKGKPQNRKIIIISSVFAGVVLLSIAWYIAWVSSQRVLSPVP